MFDRVSEGFGAIMALRNISYTALAIFVLVVPAIAASQDDYAACSSGDRDRAIAEYNEAIRLNPKYAKANYNRGIAYNRKGD